MNKSKLTKKLIAWSLAGTMCVNTMQTSAAAWQMKSQNLMLSQAAEQTNELSAEAATEDEEIVNYQYQVLADDTIEITGYTGDETELYIPEEIAGREVTVIGEGAFQGNTSLESVRFYSLKNVRVEANAFAGCTNLRSFSTNVVDVIGEKAFYNCENLTYVSTDEVYRIEADAFNGCRQLEKFNFHATIEIGDRAFYGCDAMLKLDDLENVTSIGEQALGYSKEGQVNELSITLNTKGESIAMDEYINANGIACTYLFTCRDLEDGTVEIAGYQGNEQSVLIPYKLAGKVVTAIGEDVFKDNTKIKAFMVKCSEDEEFGITKIGANAFSGCTRLEYVFGTDNVTAIGDNAFSGCTELEYAPDFKNVKEIGENAFSGCKKLEYCSFGKVENVGEKAFYGCELMDEFDFRMVKNIGKKAFAGCESLLKVSGVEHVETIGTKALGYTEDGEKLDEFVIYLNAKGENPVIEDYAKANDITCLYLYEYEALDDSTVKITRYTGADIDVTIPMRLGSKLVTVIGANVFKDNTQITNVELECNLSEDVEQKLVKIEEGAFSGCTSLETVSFAELTAIEAYAFYNCENLYSISLEKVKEIGNYAFMGCASLDSITLDSAIEEIGDYAFGYITEAEKMEYLIISGDAYDEGSALDTYIREHGFTFQKRTYSIKFMDGEETVKTQQVLSGDAAIPPAITKDGYVLSWDQDYTNVRENKVITAVWTKVEDAGDSSQNDVNQPEADVTTEEAKNEDSSDVSESTQNPDGEESTSTQNASEESSTEVSTTTQISSEESSTEVSTTTQNPSEESNTEESTTAQNASVESSTEMSTTAQNPSEESTTAQNASVESSTEVSMTTQNPSEESNTEVSTTAQNPNEESNTEVSTTTQNPSVESSTEVSTTTQISSVENSTEVSTTAQNASVESSTEVSTTAQNASVESSTEVSTTTQNPSVESSTEVSTTTQASSSGSTTGVSTTTQASNSGSTTGASATTQVPSSGSTTGASATTQAPSSGSTTGASATTQASSSGSTTRVSATTQAPSSEDTTGAGITTQVPSSGSTIGASATTQAPSGGSTTEASATTQAPSSGSTTSASATTQATQSTNTTTTTTPDQSSSEDNTQSQKPDNTLDAQFTGKKGQVITDSTFSYKYKADGTFEITAYHQKTAKKAVVPDTITIKGKKYKVTSIAKKAFSGKKKLKTVTIGKNIKAIGKQSFAGCTKLNTITFKGTKVPSIAKKAFAKVAKKAVFKVPKKTLKKYKKALTAKTGFQKGMKIKK